MCEVVLKNYKQSVVLAVAVGLSGCVFAPKKTAYLDEHCDIVREKTDIDVIVFADEASNVTPYYPSDIYIPALVAATSAAFSSVAYIYDNIQDSIEYKEQCGDRTHSEQGAKGTEEAAKSCSDSELCGIERKR
ncbi:hypothetical protein N476_25900 [Pseudoalteromonas luteoviolacea H33]|uniref:Lipoprotein n=1 Tax=Pseudoalteromonas luteoviolacea H33 TaxID=1365251 RepID=A0A167A8B9_9GAMM|nr:hypothetical protein N476_25900 [Pseudoalteromonas luteoviolacea H33]KZN79236.1 hypothetical protein N477_00115 [Pseudoalteromonas luteoviolacea H33-S]